MVEFFIVEFFFSVTNHNIREIICLHVYIYRTQVHIIFYIFFLQFLRPDQK